jgi:hypothetical protein
VIGDLDLISVGFTDTFASRQRARASLTRIALRSGAALRRDR